MDDHPQPPPTDHEEPRIDQLVLIVVGAHLRAELYDRPLAQRLARAIGMASSAALQPLVCTDLWYLNSPELQPRPVIAVGDPSVNAATAYLCNKLPTALLIEDSLRIHLEPEFNELRACIWGVNREATAAAVEVFAERYLDEFINEAQRA